MSIIVQRAPADKPGEVIISSILTTIEAQLERGKYQINNDMDDRVTMDGTVIDLDFYQPGKMARIDNRGLVKNGLITKCSGHIKVSKNVDIRSQVTVETIK